jgi:ABC-type uncharacterized transport system ATPase subunit
MSDAPRLSDPGAIVMSDLSDLSDLSARGRHSLPNALELQGICKTFGPVRANDNISLAVRPGEVHSILGENGAGKTTLMRIIAGVITPDSGTISLGGQPVNIRDPLHASELGIQMVHQHFALIDTLTVTENLYLARLRSVYRRLDLQELRRDIQELSETHRLPVEPDALVANLSVGSQQRVEIARSLLLQADVLILDEPTSVLTPHETSDLFRLIRRLTATGVSIIFISHKLSEVMEISDRISVLRDGRYITTIEGDKATAENLSEAMVGRPIVERSFVTGDSNIQRQDEPALAVREVTTSDDSDSVKLQTVSLEVYPGEILGIAGVDGNGQSELIDVLLGHRKPTEGSVELSGEGHPTGRSGVAHIPDDRLAKGLIPNMTIWQNLLLRRADDSRFLTKRGVVRKESARTATSQDLEAFGLKREVADLLPSMLSGGMQQRVLLARELTGAPSVVIAAQPTRGLDIEGTQFVRTTLDRLRAEGAAILLVSTELDEILALADRIAVMFRGQVIGEMTNRDADLVRLGLLMGGEAA